MTQVTNIPYAALEVGQQASFEKRVEERDVQLFAAVSGDNNPVHLDAAFAAGLEVTALHNHFFYETPRIFYMHVHGHGPSADIAKRIAPALALIGKTPSRRAGAAAAGKALDGKLDTAQLAKIVGQEGEQTGAVDFATGPHANGLFVREFRSAIDKLYLP